MSLLILALSFNSPTAAKKNKLSSDFIKLESTQGSDLNIFLSKADLNHNLDQGDFDLKIFFDARSLLKESFYPQNIKLEIYNYENERRNLISLINRTVKNEKAARNILFDIQLPRVEASTELFFDLYDSRNILDSSFTQEVTVSSSDIISELSTVPDFDCSSIDGECLLEYILRYVSFSANYDTRLKTQVYKNDKGRYFVNIPIAKSRKKEAKNLKVNVVDDSDDQSPGSQATTKIVLDKNDFSTNPIEGSLEYDGENLYFTNGESRSILGASCDNCGSGGTAGPAGPTGPAGPQGPTGPIGPSTASGVAGAVQFSAGNSSFDSDGNNFFWDSGNARLGIGTNTPTEFLDVAGNILSNSRIRAAASTVALPSFSFGTDTNTGIYRPAADTIGLATNATERLRVDATGNLVLSDTTAAALLDVGGGTATSIDGTDDLLVADDAEIDGDLYVEGALNVGGAITGSLNGTMNGSMAGGFTNGSVLFSNAAGVITEDNTNFFWDRTNDRLGLGTNTPGEVLDVAGNIVSNSRIRTGAGSAALPSFAFGTDTNTGIYRAAADNLALSTAGTERLRVDATGNLVLSDTTAAALLDVGGGVATNIDGIDDLLVADDAEIDGDLYATSVNVTTVSATTVNATTLNIADLNTTTGVNYNTGARPACNAGNRGLTWFTESGAGVQDEFAVCAKDAGDAYAWRVLY